MQQQDVRTSKSHPIRIDSVQPLQGWGAIGLSLCPGKQQTGALSGVWARDLTEDMVRIRNWGAELVVTLIEPQELIELQVEHLPEEVMRLGMQWCHLPIRDRYPPGPSFERDWPQALARIGALLSTGKRIFVHCKGGLGRAGTLAACLLVESGMSADEAIHAVRTARPKAIETVLQEWYVANYRPQLR